MGARRPLAAALVGCAVQLHAAHLDERPAAGRPRLLRQPDPPRRPVHRRWPDHPRSAHGLVRADRERQLLERRGGSRSGLSKALPLLIAGVLLVACGGGDDHAASTTSTTTSAPSKATIPGTVAAARDGCRSRRIRCS